VHEESVVHAQGQGESNAHEVGDPRLKVRVKVMCTRGQWSTPKVRVKVMRTRGQWSTPKVRVKAMRTRSAIHAQGQGEGNAHEVGDPRLRSAEGKVHEVGDPRPRSR
jgi:hypothetical protein